MSIFSEILSFNTPGQFSSHQKSINDMVAQNEIEEITNLDAKNLGVPAYFSYQCYRLLDNGDIWVLIEPNPPFRGSWTKVNK